MIADTSHRVDILENALRAIGPETEAKFLAVRRDLQVLLLFCSATTIACPIE